MNIAQSTSSVMVVPSSAITRRSWVVGCCMEQYNPSALFTASSHVGRANPNAMALDMTKERIRKMFTNVELSVSSYDTAWVAMVPSPNSPKSPCFPKCLNWLMNNQHDDGSWGLLPHHSSKDSLSSTLACIIALTRWNIGKDQVNKGLHYIESSFASATNNNQVSPIGFEIIFPNMLEYATKDLNINLSLNQTDLCLLLHERELELRRCHSNERDAYLAYISEGLGHSHDWNMVMKYQLKNGSLFNSPSATAAALIHHQNAGCLDYLTSLLNKFGNAVPTAYPLDLYLRLCMVDTLERLGIARHFRVEIQIVLDETYSTNNDRRVKWSFSSVSPVVRMHNQTTWFQSEGGKQIFMDIATCALAFRVLRTNGYEVSSRIIPLDKGTDDQLAKITKEGDYINSPEEPFKDIYAAIEVYRASQIIYQEELASEEQYLWSTDFLKQEILSASVAKSIREEVDDALKYPFNGSLERTRRYIEHYNVENRRILKTAYSSSNISNEDYLTLAVEDFNASQSIYRGELEDLKRWVVNNRLDKLKFAREKTTYCYFTAARMIPSPELSYARISMSKSSILATVIDDFFDVGGSMDELVNLIHTFKKWDVDVDKECCSEEVRIIFLALKDEVCWVRDNVFKWQARDITSHMVETWLDLMKSMLREATWARDGLMPTINEYMENGYVSFALDPIVLIGLYFLGPKLSEEIVQSHEYHKLFELMSTQGRLQNDIQSFKRELNEGKLNVVALYIRHGKNGITEEEVVEELKTLIANKKREMMKLVLETNGSIVPRACKDAFWNMNNALNLFYATDDGYTGNNILDIVMETIYEPVSHHSML